MFQRDCKLVLYSDDVHRPRSICEFYRCEEFYSARVTLINCRGHEFTIALMTCYQPHD